MTTVDVAKPVSAHHSTATPKHAKAKVTHPRPRWWWIGFGILVTVVVITFWPTVIGGLQNPEADIHRPGMGDFFPETMIWEGTSFQFDRLILARLIAAVVVGSIFAAVATRLKLRPGRGQLLVEMGAEFVRKNIGIELLGTRRGKRYSRILGFIFFGVLAMNLTGVIPGINIAASSVMSVPLVFAVVAYVTFIAAGIKTRGGGRFFKEQLFPPGIPWPVYILLVPIEFVSTFIVRPATLAIRLLANMIAGHMLLALTYFGTQVLLVGAGALKPLSIVTFGAAGVVTLFEIFVAVLQAYVFTVLTAVYIKMSVESH